MRAGWMLVLLVVTILAIYKPRGVTRFGRTAAPLCSTPMPRWVKLFGGTLIALTLALLVMMFAGSHGPSAHR